MAADVLLQVLADDEPAQLDHAREVAGLATSVAVCDAFSAMREGRPYGTVLTDAEAVDELHRCAGTQFDPRVVRVLPGARRGSCRRLAPVA